MPRYVTETVNFIWQEGDENNDLEHKLQKILNKYRHQVYPEMIPPSYKQFSLYVNDQEGNFIGGAIIYVYQDLAEISLLALKKDARGSGLGKKIVTLIEEKAREMGCTRIRIETIAVNIGFYQKLGYRIGERLDDYPPGFNYFRLRKDLEEEQVT